jgi:hypothetical protein
MEIKQMSLAAIQGILSRGEMKNVMAGTSTVDHPVENGCTHICSKNPDCGVAYCKTCKIPEGGLGKNIECHNS